MVANLAWRRLSPEVQRKVSTILNITNSSEVEDVGSPMGVVANWADSVRHYLPWSGIMHFINVRDDLIDGGCHYRYNNSSQTGDGLSSDLCQFQYYHRDCVDGICAVGAILNYSTQLIERPQEESKEVSGSSRYLRQRMATESERDGKDHDEPAIVDSKTVREALMFVIHFVGDIHQPLHASRTSDRGGNGITVTYHLEQQQDEKIQIEHFPDEGSHHSHTLHSVWDNAMIKTALERDYSSNPDSQPRSEMEAALESLLANHTEWLEEITNCQKGSGARHLECAINWGQESWSSALKYAYTKNSPWNNGSDAAVDVIPGDVIDEAYYSSRIPIVKEQLIAGGVRLAATLEDIFGDKNQSVDPKLEVIQEVSLMNSMRTWYHVSSLRT